MRNVYAVRKLHLFKKKLKCITEYDGFGGKYLDIDVCLSLQRWTPSSDDNEPIHES